MGLTTMLRGIETTWRTEQNMPSSILTLPRLGLDEKLQKQPIQEVSVQLRDMGVRSKLNRQHGALIS
jgi:5-enolpyruvylshikimate-3-phosphate synthase